ncbi:condensation domain-containing protein, partial [Rhodococcus qingshengii]|uniref:condensation domain-containing protein n=1 Tax=Rhodococcus qingshengii TaxID=334542 RepID=UPI0036DE5CCC
MDDDFFELGGNSLNATRLVSRINADRGTDIPLRAIFDSPTVAELAAVLDASSSSSRPALTARVRPSAIPLSPAQSRMWFLNRFEPESSAYNMPVVLRLSGALDESALAAAVGDLVLRHEVLRTVYPEVDGIGFQRILSPDDAAVDLTIEYVSESALLVRVSEVLGATFDVTSEIPVRASLLQVDEFEYVLAMTVHHIAGDGFSMGPLTRDVMVAYEARSRGMEPLWAPLEVQYADYALWQLETLGSEESSTSLVTRQLDFWRNALDAIPSVIDLPLDRPRPVEASGRGATFSAHLSPEVNAQLEKVARDNGATSFMVLHAALAVVLSRYSGEYDVVVGTPVAGRGERALDDLVGMFVNTLALRSVVSPGARFAELLESVREFDLQAFANADVPFERLVEVLDPVRSQSYSPIFQVSLTLQNIALTELEFDGIRIAEVDNVVTTTQFDLDFVFNEALTADGSRGGLDLHLTYATDLFDEATAARLVDAYVAVVSAAVADTSTIVEMFEVESVVERGLVLGGVNETDRCVEDVTLA